MTRFLTFIYLMLPSFCFSYVETDLNFIYDKQIFGVDGDNFQVSRTYNLNLAWYLTARTAFEVGYGLEQFEQRKILHMKLMEQVLRFCHENTVKNLYYSVGIRQAFSGRNSFLSPCSLLGMRNKKLLIKLPIK